VRACIAAVAGASAPARVAAVAFSAAMHSLLAVDAAGAPLTRSITWADNRAAAWAERIRADGNGAAIHRRTGTPIHPMSPLAKLVWLRHEQPALHAAAARFVGVKELVFHRLFGRWIVDHSIASATGLLELETLDWDAEALALAGVTPQRLSAPVPTRHVVAGLAPEEAARLRLPADTPFVVGANDGVLSNLGLAAIHPGEVALTIGTSGALRTTVDRPLVDPAGRSFCYALTERRWVVGGPVNNGGEVLRWLREGLARAECDAAVAAGGDPYEALDAIAARVPAGAGGLLFHPFLAGERAPWWDASLRGSYFGLAPQHRTEHMVRAAYEGVILNLHAILGIVESLVGPARRILATGGFARSPTWRQIVADVFGREVVIPDDHESSCLGAAVLGLWAVGRAPSLEVVSSMVGTASPHVPSPADAAVYARLAPIFDALPRALGPQYRAIAAFQRGQ
jgi:gluconokinase